MTSVRQFGILGKRSLPKIKMLSVRLSGRLSSAGGVSTVADALVAVTVAVSVVVTVVVTTVVGGGAVVALAARVGDGAAVIAGGAVGAALPCAAAVWLLSEQLVIKKKSNEMPKINVLDMGDLGKKSVNRFTGSQLARPGAVCSVVCELNYRL